MLKPFESNTFKNLTIVCFLVNLFASLSYSAILTEQKFKTHLRWNFFVDKNELLVTKTGNGFLVETLELSTYEKLKKALGNIQLREDYFSNINFLVDGFPQRPAQIRLTLKGPNVELFSFYRSKEKKYVLDFWKSETDDQLPVSKIELKPNKSKITKKPKSLRKSSVPKVTPALQKIKTRTVAKKNKSLFDKAYTKVSGTKISPSKGYRDFRYGASYIWDYEPISPKLTNQIDLKTKTPEYLYPIKDRDLSKNDEKEAHLQLTINLYKKGKYGLMAKSIRLYQKKYGNDKNKDFNEYLKALALIRENIYKKDSSPIKSAIVLLGNITERSRNYDLKKAIYYYNIQYLLGENSFIEVLQNAKRLYVESKNEFDREASAYAAEVIFHSLAQLKQLGKMKKFSEEKTVQNLVPKQVYFAYQFFILLKEGKSKELIREFEKIKKLLQAPVEKSILYNVAEAYFRESKYEKAIKLFDDYIANYSFTTEASFARIRLALSYEILEKEIAKVKSLYLTAIDKSTHPSARYESRVRFVGLTNARNRNVKSRDNDYMIFLEYEEDEKKFIDDNMKTLLWLTRLRTFINKENYKEALSYLSTLPIKTFTPVVRRMFQGDGAEIVYGIILKNFNKGDFARVVKLWEIYRDIYEKNVAGEPYLNFLVAQSYINLGLKDSLNRTLDNLERIKTSPARVFPMWVDRINYGSINKLVAEIKILNLIKEKNWDQVVRSLKNVNVTDERKMYYLSVALFNTNEIDKTIVVSEKFLRETPRKIPLNETETKVFLGNYLISLFQKSNYKRFEKATNAVLDDIYASNNSKKYKNFIEKINYYLVESKYAQKGKDLEVESIGKKFLKDYKDSPYLGRVRYLVGKSLVNLKKSDESLKLFEEIINDESSANYLKEMSKTEISSLRLDEKIIN